MKHFAHSEQNLQLYWLVPVKLLHCVLTDLCCSSKINLLHLVLSNQVPKLVITDCHDNPLFSKQKWCCYSNLYGLSNLYLGPAFRIQFNILYYTTKITFFQPKKAVVFTMLTLPNIKRSHFTLFTTWQAGSGTLFSSRRLHVGNSQTL